MLVIEQICRSLNPRSNDGHHLYGCSGDGTICAISFDDKELPELAELESTQAVLDEYDYQPPQRSSARPVPVKPAPSIVNGFGPNSSSSSHVNVLQPRKSKPEERKRRVELQANGSGNVDAFSAAPIQPFASPSTAQASTARMFQDAHAAFSNGVEQGESSRSGTKRKASGLEESPRVQRGRTMGSTLPRQPGEVREIRAPRVTIPLGDAGPSRSLPISGVQTLLRVKPGGGDEKVYLEAQNAESAQGKNRITYSLNGQDQWLDYLPSAVICMTMTTSFCAAACEDGSLFVYSSAGRQ